MSELTEFLLARIAEDERGEWHSAGCDLMTTHSDYDHLANCDCGVPARVLAECEAKRRIVEDLVLPFIAERRRLMGGRPLWGDEHPTLLLLLALPYADHPDFREEWKR